MFLVSIPIFIAIPFLLLRHNSARLQKILERQAIKRNGKVVPAEFLSLPTLVFPYKGFTVYVHSTTSRNNSPGSTQIETQNITTTSGFFSISPENISTQIANAFTGTELKIENPEFDDFFSIKTSDENLLRSILDWELQQLLLSLKKYYPTLSLKEGTLNLTTLFKLSDEQMLENLLKVHLTILRNGN